MGIKKKLGFSILLTVMLFASGGAQATVTIDTASVGNIGNAADSTGYGQVNYEYKIGTYEVTAGQYTEFLNAVAATDENGLYCATMWTSGNGCKIQRSGSSGSYTYSVAADWENRPVNYVTWYDCLRFANWLHNGQPAGGQTVDTTEDGSYNMSLGSDVVRKVGATVYLPNEDEWYKAAYHKNDGVTGNYFSYPTSNDADPSFALVEPDPGNHATFSKETIGSPYWKTEVGAHENSDSPYGTFDMGGNVWEWNEVLISSDPLRRGIRGGAWYYTTVSMLSSSHRPTYANPLYELCDVGFRVSKPATIEVWVDDDYTSGSCGGHTWDYDAFDNIQDGIDGVDAGGTVNVAAGTYNETIDVTTDTLTIQSVSGDPSDTIIRADSKNETVVEITNCSGVNLSGFTVRGAAEISDAEVWGVYMNNASNCSFSNINITAIETTGNNNNGGLRLFDSDNNTFNTITITDIVGPFNVYGMVLGGHSNSFTDTTISNVKNGSVKAISMAGSNYTFVSTTISDIGGVDASIAYGIFIQCSASIASNHSFTGTDISDMTADSDAIGITQWAYCTGNNFAATTISNLKSNTSAYGLLFFGLNDDNTIDTTAISNVTALAGKAGGIMFNYPGNSDNEFNATTIENVTGQSAAYGIRLYKKDLNNDFVSTEITNVNATGGDSYGISITGGANNNSFVGGSITGAESGVNTNYDFYSDNTSHNNTVEDLLLSSYSTTVSFTYVNGVGLKGVDTAPGDPTGKVNISKYVNATNVTADSWLFLNVSYESDVPADVQESTLRMWKHNGSWYEVAGSGVNTTGNYVYANITEFSIFAPLGDVDTTPPTITIDAPTQSVPVHIAGGEQFHVNFAYTEPYPANYTVTIGNATAVINSTTNTTVVGGTGMTANASFYLNPAAADGWYNVTVKMYDNSSNHNISHQNNSVEKGSYDASISQPENQTTEPSVNATYELNITNTGSFAGTFTLAVTNHNGADVAALNKMEIVNLASGSFQNATLNVMGASAGTYNVTVNVTSNDSGSEVAETGYIMTAVVGPTLTLDNVTAITRDWGINFSVNHSVAVTNASASNVNVTYNASWIDGCTFGTVNKDATKWRNQSIKNSTVQKITVKVDATTTTASATNDSETFSINITRRNIEITSQPATTQSVGTDTTFWINASANGEHEDTLVCKADLIREGSIIETQDITDDNANFSRTEPSEGTFDFSIVFYNTTHYNNASSNGSIVSVDITPPIITNVTNTTPVSDLVTITWDTDENSTSLVRCGTSTGTYNLNRSSVTMVTSHTVKLTGLSHNTIYYFVVNSTDGSGNSNESAEYNFTTAYTNGSISGIVTDSITGRPIRDATVSAGTMSARTGGDGAYLISSIAPGTYSLNATATGYAWNNSTAVTVSSGAMNSSGNVTLTPEKVTLSLGSGETTIIKSSPNGTQVIFNLTATNYGTNATFTVTNSSDAAVVTGCDSFVLNSSESKDFGITATNQTAGYYPVTITVADSISGKSASITLYAIMQNMSANYTKDEGSTINATNNASVTGGTVLVNSTVDTGANVNGSVLVHANVTEGANVTGGSLVEHSNVTGSGSSVENRSVVAHSTVDNSTMDNGAIVYNSTVVDSAVDNTTAKDSKLCENTTVTDSTIVNVTANGSTIIGVEIDTGYGITLTNATVKASTSSGSAGRPEIQGGANAIVITRGINFTNIYTDVLIEDLILQQIDDEAVPGNTSTTINASDTVKCDLTVNMTEPAQISITETGINPDGEGTGSILSDDASDWIPVGSFIYIRHNASGTGSFTIRRYYDPSLNYTDVHIYYYNTTPDPNVWERLETTANGTLGGLNWIEAVVNHLSTFVLMGTLGDGDGGDGGTSSGGEGTYPPGWFGTPAPAVTATKAPAATTTATDAPPGERVTPAPTKRPAAAKATAPAAEDTTAGTAKKGAPGFTAVFMIAGMLAVAYAMMRRRS